MAFSKSVSSIDLLSSRLYRGAISEFGLRLYEYKSSKILDDSIKDNRHIKNEKIIKDFILQYVPSALYEEKGRGRKLYVLRELGAIGPANHHPITVPADAYYRFGAIGCVIIYSLYAFFLYMVSSYTLRSLNIFYLIIYFFILISQLRLYTTDSLGLFTFLTYDLALFSLFTYALFWLTGFRRSSWTAMVLYDALSSDDTFPLQLWVYSSARVLRCASKIDISL